MDLSFFICLKIYFSSKITYQRALKIVLVKFRVSNYFFKYLLAITRQMKSYRWHQQILFSLQNNLSCSAKEKVELSQRHICRPYISNHNKNFTMIKFYCGYCHTIGNICYWLSHASTGCFTLQLELLLRLNEIICNFGIEVILDGIHKWKQHMDHLASNRCQVFKKKLL